MNICAFFGRRNIYNKIETSKKLYIEIEKAICLGICEFYNGLCGEFDVMALYAVRDLQKKYPHIKNYVIKSYMRDTKNELRYKNVYDSTIYPDIEFVPPKFCILARNKWMANKCDMAIAYVDVNWGGSYKGYSIAKKLNKPIVNLGCLED